MAPNTTFTANTSAPSPSIPHSCKYGDILYQWQWKIQLNTGIRTFGNMIHPRVVILY